MADINNFSNFNFLKGVNPPLFDAIREAESLARKDFTDCGHKARYAFEIFVNSVLRKKGLDDKITGELSGKIDSLRDENILRQIGYLKPGQSLADSPILPDVGKVDYTSKKKGEYKNIDYYVFIKRFGNANSHPADRDYEPESSFKNVLTCLKGCRLIFSKYYASQISKDIGKFEEDLMPIDKYNIYRSVTPTQQSLSKCKRELWGYSLNDRQEIARYAIIRIYDKNDVDKNFLLRNSDVFLEASKEALSGIPEGMTSFETLADINNKDSSFYITAHLFRFEPMELSAELLKCFTIKQRLELCARICSCFAGLHSSEVPIYNRMLTYNSIVVCNVKSRLIPYVIKFDYGKFYSSDQYGTVISQANKARAMIQNERSLIKYLAPEWNTITDSSSVDWEKIDIYSLGVLFSDILAGRFDAELVSLDELEELGFSDDLLDTLDMMTSESLSLRSELEYVLMIFQEETNLWN